MVNDDDDFWLWTAPYYHSSAQQGRLLSPGSGLKAKVWNVVGSRRAGALY